MHKKGGKPYAIMAIVYATKHGYYDKNTTDEERKKIVDDFTELCIKDMNGEDVSFD